MSPELGRFLVVIGVVLVVLAGLAMAGIRLPFGRLPGDITISGDRGELFVLSLLLRRQAAAADVARKGVPRVADESRIAAVAPRSPN
jgi:hypothetical protein